MTIHVWKYEACGNDFVFMPLKYCRQEIIEKICDRHYGIGADGVIASDTPDFVYYNKDGSQANLCGNGLRCFALHQYLKRNQRNGEILVGIEQYEYQIKEGEEYLIEVKMKCPTYLDYPLQKLGDFDKGIRAWLVDAGVRHIILLSDKHINNEEVEEIGKYYNSLEYFSDGINVDIIEYGDKPVCHTYERGCGLTLACGSGALACFKVLNDLDKMDNIGRIYFKNGESLLFKSCESYISMIGKARLIMEGGYING